MKRGTPEHPKMKELAFLLGIDLTYAVGIMERLWHFTAKYAPQGDIGRFTDKAIAEAVGWKRPTGTPGVTPECKLRDALVVARWLDSDPLHRLIVHDWKDHCDQTVTRLLERRGLSFCLARNSLPEPLPKAYSLKPGPLPRPSALEHSESFDTVHAERRRKLKRINEDLSNRRITTEEAEERIRCVDDIPSPEIQ